MNEFVTGVHPHDAKTFDETSEAEIEALLANPECVAGFTLINKIKIKF